MDPLIQASAVVIGLVNGIRLAAELKVNPWGFILFVCALVIGILFGALHYFGLTVETGIIVALVSSGLYRVGEKIGGQ